MILHLTPAMAEEARFRDAGHGDLYDNLAARRTARTASQVYVAGYTRRK